MDVNRWRKTVALLTLVFFANTAFAALCNLECSLFAGGAMQKAGMRHSPAHGLGHHSMGSSRGCSTAAAAAPIEAAQCEHPLQVTSGFKLTFEKPLAAAVVCQTNLHAASEDAAIHRAERAESPPLLSQAPREISLRI